jgi:hypothetical protein
VARAPSYSSTSLSRGVAEVALHCAHRTTTASSWGLWEQEGHSAALPHPSKLTRLFLQRVVWLILDCARRTSTSLSCAFREQTALLPS